MAFAISANSRATSEAGISSPTSCSNFSLSRSDWYQALRSWGSISPSATGAGIFISSARTSVRPYSFRLLSLPPAGRTFFSLADTVWRCTPDKAASWLTLSCSRFNSWSMNGSSDEQKTNRIDTGKIFIPMFQWIEVVVMADKNAKIWLFPRVLAPSVFRIARSTY